MLVVLETFLFQVVSQAIDVGGQAGGLSDKHALEGSLVSSKCKTTLIQVDAVDIRVVEQRQR